MKTRLPKRLMITCLIISPFFTMAQKQFVPSKVTTKSSINFKTVSLRQQANTEVATEINPFVANKINLLANLPRTFVNSPLLPKSKSTGTSLDLPVANSFSNNGIEDKILKSPAPLKAFKGSKENRKKLYPPDPSGAVGPDYVMHTNNQEYVISDKTGALVLSLPVDTFWNGFAGSAVAIGYPHIEYDANLGHYYISSLGGSLTTGDYVELFGSSVTNDPTGNWNLYSIDLGPLRLQDAPQMGYSNRWFTFTTMQYDTSSFAFVSSKVYLMSVAQMAAGTLSSIFSIEDVNFYSMSPVETQDAAINNHYLVSNLGTDADSGYLYVVHIAGTLAAPTYNYDGYVTKASPWSSTPVYGSQNGTTDQIWLGNTKLTGAVLRNSHIFTSHSVYLPAAAPTRAAVQYWDFTVASRVVNQLGRVEDNNNVNMYAFPSIAVNSHNDILLGYNAFSSTTYPSGAYSYRNGTDAASSLRKSKTYKKGKASYFEGGSAGLSYYWGNYTSTSVDPTDGSFWTVQEYAEKPANTWGTWWAHVDDVAFAPENDGQKADQVSVINISPNPAKGFANISWNEDKTSTAKVQISNAQGVILITKQVNTQKGMNSLQMNIGNLVTGFYSVTIYNGTDVKKAQLMVR